MADIRSVDNESVGIFNPTSTTRCETTLQQSKISYVWTINNFSLFTNNNGLCIKSPIFSSTQNAVDKNRWCLELCHREANQTVKPTIVLGQTSSSIFEQQSYPLFGQTHSSTFGHATSSGTFASSAFRTAELETQPVYFLSLYLRLVSSNQSQVLVKYKMSIISDKKEVLTRIFGKEIVKPGDTVSKNDRLIETDQLMKQKEELLPSDSLTLFLEATTVIWTSEAFFSECTTLKGSECRIHHDLGCLLEKQECTDVTIVTQDGRGFRAHKAILAARSPVFAAMFKNEMSENKTNRVEIADMSHDVLSEMLKFMYTGRATNLDKIGAELLAAADKYELRGLQNICEKEMTNKMTVETAAEFLILADLHHMENLKTSAIDIIKSHFEEIKKTKGWMIMTKTHPQLIIEAFL